MGSRDGYYRLLRRNTIPADRWELRGASFRLSLARLGVREIDGRKRAKESIRKVQRCTSTATVSRRTACRQRHCVGGWTIFQFHGRAGLHMVTHRTLKMESVLSRPSEYSSGWLLAWTCPRRPMWCTEQAREQSRAQGCGHVQAEAADAGPLHEDAARSLQRPAAASMCLSVRRRASTGDHAGARRDSCHASPHLCLAALPDRERWSHSIGRLSALSPQVSPDGGRLPIYAA